jgi:hypothetical protein
VEASPANVELFEIAVAVELGDAGRALQTAEAVDTAGLSAERRARMLIDVARAHTQRRQVADAVTSRRLGTTRQDEGIWAYIGHDQVHRADLIAPVAVLTFPLRCHDTLVPWPCRSSNVTRARRDPRLT